MKNNGIIAINKPKDWTSFDVVNKLKFKFKPLKVGHLGTLDPMATGVLLVTIGKATKLFDLMQEKVKTYVAEFEFGYETDTLDVTGEKLNSTNQIPIESEIKRVLPNFIGEIAQIPPKYSAKSVGGVRAYDLARNNVEFELKPRDVQIYNIKFISYQNRTLKLEITCGSGTYIRAIGRDIAKELKTYATMTSLIRTKVGNIDLNKCQDIQSENFNVLKIDEILDYPILKLNDIETKKLLNGQTLATDKKDGNYILKQDENTLAIVKISKLNMKMSIFLG